MAPDHQPLTLHRVNITKVNPNASVTLLGDKRKLKYTIKDGQITIETPKLQPFQRPSIYAYPFKLSGFEFGPVDTSMEADASGSFVLLPTDVKRFVGSNVANGNTESGRVNIRGWFAGDRWSGRSRCRKLATIDCN